MITLNRLGHTDEPFQLNVEMIVTVESTPDTIITLANGTKVVVSESPEQVAAAVHDYRASVLAEAFSRRGRPSGAQTTTPFGGSQSQRPSHLSAVEDEPS